MAYNKAHLQAMADALLNMGIAFSDGFQLADDSDEMMALVPAAINSADEFKEDLPSALMHLGGRLMEMGGDLRRTKKDATPTP